MKNKKIFIVIFVFIILILLGTTCLAKDLDQINEYHITVEPRKDGSLDISYHIEWEVLKATPKEPVTWVTIGIPNGSVDSVKSTSKTVKTIKSFEDRSGSYVRIDFKNEYTTGDIIIFDFSIHQKNMYQIDSQYYVYSFTPGWFDEIEVKDIQILWNPKNVSSSNAKEKDSKNYLKWSGKLKKGKKLEAKVKYEKGVFSYSAENTVKTTSIITTTNSIANSNISTNEIEKNLIDLGNNLGGSAENFQQMVQNAMSLFGVGTGMILVGSLLSMFTGTGYRRHRGYAYDDDDDYRHNRSSRSTHSCVTSCACACACAGGGRAGCSKKDFYGTNLRTKNIKKVLNK